MFKRFFQKNRKLVWGLFAAVLLFVAIVPVPAGAVEFSPAGFVSGAVDLLASPFKPVLQLLLMIPMNFAAWLLWLSGVFLNSVLTFTVVNLTENINSTTGINSAWAVIRDLANMSFIFILLYSAIKTILGDGGSIKNVVVGTVIAAVLVNFSLFFAKVIIDISNIVALTFYNQIIPEGGLLRANGLADSIMQPLGVTTIFRPIDSAAQLLTSLTKSLTQIVVVSVGSSIFMYVTAGIFFAIAGMFITRYVSIIFLLVLSPVAILGTFLPQFKSYGNAWWNRLTSEALFAPVFMVMMWVTLTIINSYSFMCPGTESTLAQLFSGIMTSITDGANGTAGACSKSATGLLMNFVIAISFVSATLVIAKKVANHSGSVAQEIAGKLTSPFTGAAGWAGRQTMGRGTAALVNSKWLNTAASQKFDGRPGSTLRGLVGVAGRAGVQQGQSFAKKNFDPAAALGFAASANKNGYADRKKQDEKERQEAQDKVQGINDREKIQLGIDATKDAAAFAAAQAAVAAGRETPEQRAMIQNSENMEKTLANMSGKQLETLITQNKELLKNEVFAQAIGIRQIEAINKGTELNEEEKKQLNNSAFKEMQTILDKVIAGTASSDERKKIGALSAKEVEYIDPKYFSEQAVIGAFGQGTVEDMAKSDKYTRAQRAEFKDKRKASVRDRIVGAGAGINLKDFHIKDLAGLAAPDPSTIPPPSLGGTLLDPNLLGKLTKSDLKKIAPELNSEQRLRLKDAIDHDPRLTDLARWMTPGSEGESVLG